MALNYDQLKAKVILLKETEIKTFNNSSTKGAVAYRSVGSGYGGNMTEFVNSYDALSDSDIRKIADDTDFDSGFDVAFLIRPAKIVCK